MISKHVKLTVPETLYKEGQQLVREFGYSNIQDLTIDGLRKQIIDLKKQQALINLKKNLGSVRPKQRLTKQERERIAEKSLQRANEITKKYDLEDIQI